jgi:hypothetical protein
MDMYGLSNALEQQESLTHQAEDMNSAIAQQNAIAMEDYHQRLSGLKTGDKQETEKELTKIGAYSLDGINKLKEYRTAVKEGKIEGGLTKSLTAKRLGKISRGDFSDLDFSTTGKRIAPDDPSLKNVKTDQSGLGDATAEEQQGKILSGEDPENPDEWIDNEEHLEHYTAPTEPTAPLGRSGQGETFLEQITREETGEILKNPQMRGATLSEKIGSGVEGTLEGLTGSVKGLTKAGSTATKLGKSALEGLGRTAGGLMGVAMLGDDIYNQVNDHKFFTGDNIGEKVGNFANEVGSVMDVAGAMTGDPFLVLAGAGVGAVGSVVDEISGLFAHKSAEKEATQKLKPQQQQEVASQNIVGAGRIAEGSASTLKQVSAY